jgi:iron-sulfur cluster repair protein YtfE (RIC family)
MEATRSLPKRFTAIAKDHERLGVSVRRLGDMCSALESEQSALAPELEPVTLLADLLADLSQHFVAEEAQAHFGTMVLERPALVHKIAELIAEHRAMLQAIAELDAIAADERRWNELSTPARRLIARLRAHEHTENELLQDYLLRDDGTASD